MSSERMKRKKVTTVEGLLYELKKIPSYWELEIRDKKGNVVKGYNLWAREVKLFK